MTFSKLQEIVNPMGDKDVPSITNFSKPFIMYPILSTPFSKKVTQFKSTYCTNQASHLVVTETDSIRRAQQQHREQLTPTDNVALITVSPNSNQNYLAYYYQI